MLTKGAIESLFTLSLAENPPITLQIISVKLRKSGYILKISDSSYYTKALYINHNPIPSLYSIISLQNYEFFNNSKLLILLNHTKLQDSTSKIGNPIEFPIQNLIKSGPLFTPIRSISFSSTSWLIKARLIEKSEVELADNHQGLCFWGTFMDENNDDIQLIFLNSFVDSFYTELQEKKLYLISGGKLRKNYRKNSNSKLRAAIFVEKSTKIIEVFDDKTVKLDKYTFTDIKTLYKLTIPKRIDTCGVIKSIHKSEVTSVEIQDLSNSVIQLFCNEFSNKTAKFSVIVCKNVQYEPNSGILISDSSSQILVNPLGIAEVDALKELSMAYWKSIQYYHTISEVKELIFSKVLPDEIEFTGTIGEILCSDLHPFWYPACINIDRCSKKVESHSSGFYYCVHCNTKSGGFVYRYGVEICIYDCTGKIILKAFDPVARALLGVSAEELVMNYYSDKKSLDRFFGSVVGNQMIFTIASKQISKSIPISKIQLINPSSMSKALMSEIREVVKL
ncbi:hypothetical protein SteCoe_16095 [Stentor coeruleus]|uniref:Replication factor A C-terminal domain-containing protein n=1 Tax=Stentor coeruleus TaxID=5963 RepID=A0A1R2C259_9CILI|nr:hypothetical protein SteCoe_16095 [Stentor coeruleus]